MFGTSEEVKHQKQESYSRNSSGVVTHEKSVGTFLTHTENCTTSSQYKLKVNHEGNLTVVEIKQTTE